MQAISGVATKTNSKGKLTHITIDVRKHEQVVPVLKELGLVPKTQFEMDCEDALSVKEVFDNVRETIKNHYTNRRNKTAG